MKIFSSFFSLLMTIAMICLFFPLQSYAGNEMDYIQNEEHVITFHNDTEEGEVLLFTCRSSSGLIERRIPLKPGGTYQLKIKDTFWNHLFFDEWYRKYVKIMDKNTHSFCSSIQCCSDNHQCIRNKVYGKTKIQTGEVWNVSTLKENYKIYIKHCHKFCCCCNSEFSTIEL